MTEPVSRRWDTDERGRGVGDARANLPAIEQLAELAALPDWVTEEAEAHLLPGLNKAIAGTGLTIRSAAIDPDGALRLELSSAGAKKPRDLRQAVWTALGGVAEITTHVHESRAEGQTSFDVVTGIAPGGRFATHGHTLRLVVSETP
jgi:hypothetical protein